MCELERVVYSGFLHTQVCLYLSGLLLGVSEWAVARRFTTLWFMCEPERVVRSGFLHTQVCLHLSGLLLGDSPCSGLCVNLSELFTRGFSTLRYVCI